MLPLFFKFYGVEEHARSGSRGVDGRAAGELRSSSERVGNHTSGGRSSNCAGGELTAEGASLPAALRVRFLRTAYGFTVLHAGCSTCPD